MYEREIQEMKEAAEQRNWERFQQALKFVVCEIKQETLIELLLSYIRIFMTGFLEINPQHKLGYDTLPISDDSSIILNYLERIIDILEQHRGEPGINNFRRGTLKLKKLSQLQHCDEIFIETFITSTTNVLLSISHQSWGTKHPDLYNRWLHGRSNEDLSILALDYARDPEQIQKVKFLLHQYTDDINKYLSVK